MSDRKCNECKYWENVSIRLAGNSSVHAGYCCCDDSARHAVIVTDKAKACAKFDEPMLNDD